jgi:hypothetical protein
LAQAQLLNYDATTTAKAQDFADNFLYQWSRPNSVALPFVRSVINDKISFYGKVLSRDAYMTEQEAFATRWPDRAYSTEPNSEDVNCDNAISTCTVTGIEYWNDFSPARHMITTGAAKFSLSLHVHEDGAGKDPTFFITAETGSVISSELDDALGPSDVLVGPSANSNLTSISADSSDQLVTNAAIQKAGCISPDGPLQHQNCKSVSEIDLTGLFHTSDRTVFEVTQASSNQNADFPPSLSFCFVHPHMIQCHYGLTPGDGFGQDELVDTSIINPESGHHGSLLRAQLLTDGLAGCGGLNNYIWGYDPTNNVFNLFWTRPYDCHTALRFETRGPLAGDMIAVDSDVTDRWPWPYGIEVYKFEPPDHLVKILYMIGKAGQGGTYVTGPNDAIDVDMSEILRRLGVSR